MIKIYNFVFYKLYQFFKLINKEMPAFLAVMSLCWIFLFNLVSFMGLFLLNHPEYVIYTNKSVGLIIGLMIFIFHGLYYLNGRNVERIEKEYSIINKKIDILGTIGVIMYVAISSIICLIFIVPRLDDFF